MAQDHYTYKLRDKGFPDYFQQPIWPEQYQENMQKYYEDYNIIENDNNIDPSYANIKTEVKSEQNKEHNWVEQDIEDDTEEYTCPVPKCPNIYLYMHKCSLNNHINKNHPEVARQYIDTGRITNKKQMSSSS